MYSTKELYPKKCDSYITIGDDYDKPKSKLSRHTAKQFQTAPPKKGPHHGLFGKEEYKYSHEEYADGHSYLEREGGKDRRVGFGSRDFSKRDEFMHHIRTQQWRETLKKEMRLASTALAGEAAAEEAKEPEPALRETKRERRRRLRAEAATRDYTETVTRRLYDIGRGTGDGTTPVCNKCPRDTFFCKHRGGYRERRTGGLFLSSRDIGFSDDEVTEKPEFGRKGVTREFYDSGHLHAGH
eukprot:PLAT11041.1.p2 GENE.PLAT11041.1~~PLAT11041.1.p2  ORF type:complete len:240 (-),score=105.82 PLAT11041.1:140-859(-)